MSQRKGPVVIELETEADIRPEVEAPVDASVAQQTSLQQAARVVARKPSRLARWFWSLTMALLGFVVSLAAWDYVNALLARSPVLGLIATALLGAVLIVLAVIALRELAALGRLQRLDALQKRAIAARADHDLPAARDVVERLEALFAKNAQADWGLAALRDRKAEVMDADGLLDLAEQSLLQPLDARAVAEVEAAARQVATVTAIVPLALADVFVALSANLRMIRRIAEVYGGRGGTLGAWRLVRAVMGHLVATGAVAVGDDLIGSVAGGGVMSKVSRRFGEGVINGALTARLGLAAMEVCRPLPFEAVKRPSVTSTVRRALTGLFSVGKSEKEG